MKINFFIFSFTYFICLIFHSYACLKIQECQCIHEYDPKILAEVDNDTSEVDDDYLYDFSLSTSKSRVDPRDMAAVIHENVQKITRFFDLKKFDKCLQYIKIVEKHQHIYDIREIDQAKILAYKAYCHMYLKKYECAVESFENLINYLTVIVFVIGMLIGIPTAKYAIKNNLIFSFTAFAILITINYYSIYNHAIKNISNYLFLLVFGLFFYWTYYEMSRKYKNNK